MKTLTTLLILLTTLFSHSQVITSIPFTVENNAIFFYCKVNETDSLKFLFDTGANGTVINESSIHKLKLKIDGKSMNVGSNGQNEVEESSNNEMVIGTIHKKNVVFTIIPYDTDQFDGVLGTDVMAGNIIEIDYHKQVLNFYPEDDKTINFKGFTKSKMVVEDYYPTIIKSTMVIEGKKYTGLFGVDTGADNALTIASPYARKQNFNDKMPKMGTSSFQGSDGSVIELSIVLCPEIQLAGISLYRVPAALSTSTEGIDATDKLAGFYGNALLKKFNIILDYKNKLIYFKVNKNLYLEFYED